MDKFNGHTYSSDLIDLTIYIKNSSLDKIFVDVRPIQSIVIVYSDDEYVHPKIIKAVYSVKEFVIEMCKFIPKGEK